MTGTRKYLSLHALSVLLLILLLTAGCSSTDGGADKLKDAESKQAGNQAVAGGFLRYALLDEPPALDPARFDEELGLNVGKEIYDGLVDYDYQQNKVVSAHAERWTVQENRIYTFFLRQGARFHNGKEVTAEDFRYSFDRLLNPGTGATTGWILQNVAGATARMAGKTTSVDGIKVIDKYTLEITLEQPYVAFLAGLTHPAAAVVDKEAVEKAGKAYGAIGAKSGEVVGSGPFALAQWVPKSMVKLVRNEDYYARKAYLDGVEFRVIADETTTLNEFRAGGLDLINRIPPGQMAQVEKEFPGQVIRNTVWKTEFYAINTSQEPFKDNIKLRQALNYAIDREGIIKAVLEGNGVPAKGVLPPDMAEYNSELKGFTYDKARAAQLLSEAGYPNGDGLPELELAYNFRETNQKIAEIMQAQLKEIGVKSRLRPLERSVYGRELQSGKLGMFRLGWSADFQDADSMLYPMFYSKPGNFFNYRSQEVDRLLTQARTEEDRAERLKTYRAVEERIVLEAPAVWLFHPVNVYLKGSRINGVGTNMLGLVPLSNIWISG